MHRSIILAIGVVLSVSTADAAQPVGKAAVVETVLGGLRDPRGVAIRPGGTSERYEMFVAEPGAGRILLLRSDEPGAPNDAITGFPTDADPGRNSGPCCLLFVDREHLIVGCGSQPAARMYELAEQVVPQSANDAKQSVGGEQVEEILALGRTRANDHVPDVLVAACVGRDKSARLAKILVRAGTLDKLRPFVSADQVATDFSPTGIAVNQQGVVAVSQVEVTADSRQSWLTFFNPADGSRVLALQIPLREMVGLAYSSRTGNLYAVGLASGDEKSGGVFRLDDAGEPGTPACRAEKVAAIDRPTGLAFAPDGALYVSAQLDLTEADANRGALLKLTGDL